MFLLPVPCLSEATLVVTSALSHRQTAILGFVVLLALVLGAVGIFSVGDSQGLWRDRVHVWARFPQISGIDLGTRVRIKGINAGQVDAIEQPSERNGDVLVSLSVERRLFALLGSDARAVILSEGLIGGKVIELEPGTTGQLEAGAVIAGQPDQMMLKLRDLANRSNELMDEFQTLTRQAARTLGETQGLVQDIRTGQGPMGRELVGSLRQLQHTSESVGQGFDAMKNVPFVGRYVDAPTRLLVRPRFARHTFVIAEKELFEPGRANLTAQGRARLDALAANDLAPFSKAAGSEIVVVVCTGPTLDERAAQVLTEEQAAAVCTYLVDQHKVNRLSWWTGRNVTPLGMGTRSVPGSTPSSSDLPSRRVEIIVFVPPTKEGK
jgi:phospholipid/cholesterol/gamma-HCH transport system substrate-binding protein